MSRIIITLFAVWFFRASSFILVLDPAGNAQQAGRVLEQGYERGLTLQLCAHIKKMLNTPSFQVFVARSAGDRDVDPLRAAQASNIMNADLFLSIRMYKETSTQPQLWIYYMQQDAFIPQRHATLFYPYDKTWIIAHTQTTQYARAFYNEFYSLMPQGIHKPAGFPCKPLLGIQAPALLLEIGVPASSSIEELGTMIARAIENIHHE